MLQDMEQVIFQRILRK